jgi:hypothetical protein
MTLTETLTGLGITDPAVLPEKTQRKLKEYNKTLNHPFSRNKTTGEFTTNAKVKLDDLAEDIIVEAKLYLKKANTPPPPPPPAEPTEEELAQAAEAERLRLEGEAAEKLRLEAEAAKNKKGPLQDFFGW